MKVTNIDVTLCALYESKKKKKNLKTSIKVDEQIYLVVTASKNTGKNYSMKHNITEVFDTEC